MIAALALSAALAVGPAGIDPRDPYPVSPPGPTCYGATEWHNVWNLVNPTTAYSVNSCIAAELSAKRNLAGNYANYVALVAARVPALFPVSVYSLAWNTGNSVLSECASHGRGVTFYQSGFNGMVITCSAQ
jgi:hypothetical protein